MYHGVVSARATTGFHQRNRKTIIQGYANLIIYSALLFKICRFKLEIVKTKVLNSVDNDNEHFTCHLPHQKY